MKKLLKIALPIALLAILLWIAGVDAPFVANRAREAIKPGMAVEQVAELLSSYGRRPEHCRWMIEGSNKVASRQCAFPREDIPLGREGGGFQLAVTFTGPAFQKNSFSVSFDRHGKVLSISKLEQWD
jgi:hypothetical protein